MSEGGPAPSASSDLLRLEHAPDTAHPFVVQPVRKTQKVPISPLLARVQAFLPQMSAANERLQHSGTTGKDMCCVEIVPQTDPSEPASPQPPPTAAASATAAAPEKKGRARARGNAHRRQHGSPARQDSAAQKPYVLMNVLVPNPDAEQATEVEEEEKEKPVAAPEASTGLAAMQQEIARGVRGGAGREDGSASAAHLDGMTDEQREAMLLQLFALQNNLELAQQRQQECSSDSDSDTSDSDSDSDSDSGQEVMAL